MKTKKGQSKNALSFYLYLNKILFPADDAVIHDKVVKHYHKSNKIADGNRHVEVVFALHRKYAVHKFYVVVAILHVLLKNAVIELQSVVSSVGENVFGMSNYVVILPLLNSQGNQNIGGVYNDWKLNFNKFIPLHRAKILKKTLLYVLHLTFLQENLRRRWCEEARQDPRYPRRRG